MVKIAVLLLLATNCAAAADIVLRAERESSGFAAQQALVFETNQLRYTRNSNFLCAAATETFLGAFTSPYDARSKVEQAQLEQIALRIPRPATDPTTSPHELHLFVGASDVSAQKPISDTVLRMLERACTQDAWKAAHAVRAVLERRGAVQYLKLTKFENGKEGLTTRKTVAQAKCLAEGSVAVECPIRGYGRAYLSLTPGTRDQQPGQHNDQ